MDKTEEKENVEMDNNSPTITTSDTDTVKGGKVNFFKRIIKPFKQKDSFIGSTLNLINCVVGAGVLFLPFVYKVCGLFFGTVFLFIGCFIMTAFRDIGFLAIRIGMIQEGYRFRTMDEFALLVFGKIGFWSVKIGVFISTIGVLISYMIVMSDLVISILGFEPVLYVRVLVSLVLCIIETLICSVEKIKQLRFMSVIGISSIVIYFVITFILFITGYTKIDKVGKVQVFPDSFNFWTIYNFFSISGIINFSFNTLAVYQIACECEVKNLKKVRVSIYLGNICVFIFYVLFALIGYFSFLDSTGTNNVLNFNRGDVVSYVLRVLILGELLATYPMVNYVTSRTLEEFFIIIITQLQRCFKKNKKNKDKKEEKKIGRLKKWLRLTSVTIFITIVVYIFAVFVPDSQFILGILGTVFAVLLSYAFPAAAYLVLDFKNMSTLKAIFVIDLTILVFGLFGLYPLIVILLKQFGVHKIHNGFALDTTNLLNI